MSVKYSPLCDTDRSAYLSYLVLSRVGQVAPAEVEGLLQQVKDGLKEFDESGGVAGGVVRSVVDSGSVDVVVGVDVSGGARATSGFVGVEGARDGGIHGGTGSGVPVAASVARSVGSWRRDGVVANTRVGDGTVEVGVSSVPGVATASGPGGFPFVADGSAFSAHGSAPRVARGMAGVAARVGGAANDKRVIPDGVLKSHARGSVAVSNASRVDSFGKQKGDVFSRVATGQLVADVGSRFKSRTDSRFLSFDVNGFDTGVLWRDSLAQMQGMLALISGEFQTVSTALLNGEGYTPGVVDLARAFGIFAHAQRDLVEAGSYAEMDAGRRAAFDLKMASTLMDMRGVYRSCCGRRRGGGVKYQSSAYEEMSAAASRMADSLSGNTRPAGDEADGRVGKNSGVSSLRGVCEFVRSDVSVEGFSRGRGKTAKSLDVNAGVLKVLEDRKKELQLEEKKKKKEEEDRQSLLKAGARSPLDCGCWRIGCPVCSSTGRASASAAAKAAAGVDKQVLRLRNDLAVAKSELESMRRLYEAERAEKEEYKRDALQNCGYD